MSPVVVSPATLTLSRTSSSPLTVSSLSPTNGMPSSVYGTSLPAPPPAASLDTPRMSSPSLSPWITVKLSLPPVTARSSSGTPLMSASTPSKMIASGGKGSVILLWDLAEGKRLYCLNAGSVIHVLCFCPNRYWLCAAIEQSIKIWDLESKSIVEDLKVDLKTEAEKTDTTTASTTAKKNNIYCTSLSWSADRSTLFSGYTDSVIRVWGIGHGHRWPSSNSRSSPEEACSSSAASLHLEKSTETRSAVPSCPEQSTSSDSAEKSDRSFDDQNNPPPPTSELDLPTTGDDEGGTTPKTAIVKTEESIEKTEGGDGTSDGTGRVTTRDEWRAYARLNEQRLGGGRRWLGFQANRVKVTGRVCFGPPVGLVLGLWFNNDYYTN
ncbi:hypothetical protein Q3G72_020941 [Acer saccharum]|nr:hypothetical protein Q3G72_020941 [Acer saccharum]